MVDERSRPQDNEKLSKPPEIRVAEFAELTPWQVAKMYAIRFNVFVREQQSIFDEHDGHDFDATHLFIEDENKIIAYARVFKKDEKTAVIGRVAVDKDYRGQGLGRDIIQKSIDTIKTMKGVDKIDIEAQTYLQEFYKSFGFTTTSKPYDDDGVMHVDMTLNISA